MPIRRRKYVGLDRARKSFELGYHDGVKASSPRSRETVGLMARRDLSWPQWNRAYRDGYIYGHQARETGLSPVDPGPAWRLTLDPPKAELWG